MRVGMYIYITIYIYQTENTIKLRITKKKQAVDKRIKIVKEGQWPTDLNAFIHKHKLHRR